MSARLDEEIIYNVERSEKRRRIISIFFLLLCASNEKNKKSIFQVLRVRNKRAGTQDSLGGDWSSPPHPTPTVVWKSRDDCAVVKFFLYSIFRCVWSQAENEKLLFDEYSEQQQQRANQRQKWIHKKRSEISELIDSHNKFYARVLAKHFKCARVVSETKEWKIHLKIESLCELLVGRSKHSTQQFDFSRVLQSSGDS